MKEVLRVLFSFILEDKKKIKISLSRIILVIFALSFIYRYIKFGAGEITKDVIYLFIVFLSYALGSKFIYNVLRIWVSGKVKNKEDFLDKEDEEDIKEV